MVRAAKGEGSIYKTDKGWRGAVTVDGKRKYFSAPTKADAARKRRALLLQRDTGQLVAGQVPTLAAWLKQWMKVTESDRAQSTNAGYQGYIDNYIVPQLGTKKIDKLTIDDLDNFYAELESRGMSGSTRHQCHSIIRVALKHAVWRGHLGRNVAAMVKPPTPSKSQATSLSEADMLAVYRAIENDRFRARWHLSLDFGLRPGEAIALEWPHIDFERATMRVEQQILQIRGKGAQLISSTKTGSGTREIALPEYMLDMLRELRQQQLIDMASRSEWKTWEPDGKPHAWCFTRPDGSVLRPGYDTSLWKKVVESAGLPHTRRYTARHTAASMAISDGADIPAVSEMMGHSNPAVTLSIYTHAIEERKVALADQAAARFAARTEDKLHNKLHQEK
ncbi:site-specific integrase [Leucobacter viscericola]|uniref:Site-specific integrase n=1 Tax=Leucobacter viscericola TaxID=2714935 RepID=A0A6G7XGV4_9MICO|nr:site-specific integrase [Leucobacter viscericola]QIK63795.1 site-specific integrase [Leucobacter viscericola]